MTETQGPCQKAPMISTVQVLHIESWDLLILAYYPTPLLKFDYQQGKCHVTAPAVSQTLSHPSFMLKQITGCIISALYPGAGAEILTVINKTKNPRPYWGKEKTHTCTINWLSSHSQEQPPLFSHAAADSQRSHIGQAQGIGKGVIWPEGMKSNDIPFLSCTCIHNKQMSQSERKETQSAAPQQRAWLVCSVIAVVLSVKAGHQSSQHNAHNCFYPLENKLVRGRIKLICEQCLPFFSPPSRQAINDIKD